MLREAIMKSIVLFKNYFIQNLFLVGKQIIYIISFNCLLNMSSQKTGDLS